MAVSPSSAKEKVVNLELDFGDLEFSRKITFNWFAVEKMKGGALVRLAWFSRNGGGEIHSFALSSEGLRQLQAASGDYIKEFSVAPKAMGEPPEGKILPPSFTNFVQLSRSGEWAETGFFVIPLSDIANIARGQKKGKIRPIGIALCHSGSDLHEQLVLSLFAL
jgi:hypothetical protein